MQLKILCGSTVSQIFSYLAFNSTTTKCSIVCNSARGYRPRLAPSHDDRYNKSWIQHATRYDNRHQKMHKNSKLHVYIAIEIHAKLE